MHVESVVLITLNGQNLVSQQFNRCKPSPRPTEWTLPHDDHEIDYLLDAR